VRPWQLGAMVALTLSFSLAAGACELVLSEHRSGRALLRLPLDPLAPAMQIEFTHSVLGTAVVDHYAWRAGPSGWFAQLVQESFEGEGYGLPAAAGEGEVLVRDGARWRLYLQRKVDPLVVRPLPAQRMRLRVAHQADVLRGSLSTQSINMQVQDCPAPTKAMSTP